MAEVGSILASGANRAEDGSLPAHTGAALGGRRGSDVRGTAHREKSWSAVPLMAVSRALRAAPPPPRGVSVSGAAHPGTSQPPESLTGQPGGKLARPLACD